MLQALESLLSGPEGWQLTPRRVPKLQFFERKGSVKLDQIRSSFLSFTEGFNLKNVPNCPLSYRSSSSKYNQFFPAFSLKMREK